MRLLKPAGTFIAGNSIKTTILELAKAKGMRTGIITTDSISGATPGAFGAHEPSRTYEADIRADYSTTYAAFWARVDDNSKTRDVA